MLSAAYCDQIDNDPFTQHYNRSLYNKLVIVIIKLMLLVSVFPKVITLSGFHCSLIIFIKCRCGCFMLGIYCLTGGFLIQNFHFRYFLFEKARRRGLVVRVKIHVQKVVGSNPGSAVETIIMHH